MARRPGYVPRPRALGGPQRRPRPAHRARRRLRVHLQRVHVAGRAARGRRVGLEPHVTPRRRPSRRPRRRRHGARHRALLRLGLPGVWARPWRLVRHLALDVPGGRPRRHVRPRRSVGPRPRQHLPPRPAADGALADHAPRVRLVGPPEPGSAGHHRPGAGCRVRRPGDGPVGLPAAQDAAPARVRGPRGRRWAAAIARLLGVGRGRTRAARRVGRVGGARDAGHARARDPQGLERRPPLAGRPQPAGDLRGHVSRREHRHPVWSAARSSDSRRSSS